MRPEPAASRATSAPPARAAQPPGRDFAAALAAARARQGAGAGGAPRMNPALLALGLGDAPGGAAPVLAQRRRGADAQQETLRDRREEADPTRPAAATAPTPPLLAAPPGAAEVAPRAPLLPPAAVEKAAFEVLRGARPALELSFGRDVGLRLTRTAAGVELVLHAAEKLRGAAQAELPAIVEALRARGVRVASAVVDRPPGGARLVDGAMPLRYNGPAGPGGTVAKW